MHRLLKRQLKRVFGENAALPVETQALIAQVDAAYEQNDVDRAMVERSMDIMSQELIEQNRRLSSELEERRAAEARLALSSSILGATLSSTNDGILIVGQDRRVASYNDKFLDMWRIPRELAHGGSDHELLAFVATQLADSESFLKHVEDVSGSDAKTFDLVEFGDGRVFERYSQPHCLGSTIVGRIWSFRDITDHRRAEEQLRYLANYDGLTGLTNRNLLLDRLSHAIASAHQRPGDLVAVLHIDIDQLKIINDGLGLGVGDKMLRAIAERLAECARENDTVARIGSDEFVVVLSDLFGDDVDNQQLIAEVLQRILKIVAQPVAMDGRELNVTCSIGVSLYPQDGSDAEALLRNANAAMFRAKERGRNNGQFYTAEMNERMKERLTLRELLRYAIPRGEFALHYQPKINVCDGSLAGVEALLRWNSGELGFVGPDRFIPVLEQTGMITEVGEWVLNRAVSDQRAWKAAGLPAPRIAVNISPIQLNQADFVEVVAQALSGGDAEIDLEITESLIMEDVEANIAKLQAVQAMGVGIEIDDFGTGYSSLSYLTKLPVSALKIDRAFIRNLTTNSDDHAVVTAVITLAHGLNLAVVAEGVETAEQSALLTQLGCDEIQGFLISRPLPGEKLWAWYAEYSARVPALAVRAVG